MINYHPLKCLNHFPSFIFHSSFSLLNFIIMYSLQISIVNQLLVAKLIVPIAWN